MRQEVPEGCVLARVGDLGSLLDRRDQVVGLFGRELARGTLLTHPHGGVATIEWDVDGFEAVPIDAPEILPVLARLREACRKARWAAREVEALMRRGSSTSVELGLELAEALGADARTPRVAATELRPLRDALVGIASGVIAALARGDVLVRDGEVQVVGWAFVPIDQVDTEESTQPWVSLEVEYDRGEQDEASLVFRWVAGGGAQAIDLVEVRPYERHEFGLVEIIVEDPDRGMWRLPADRVDRDAGFAAVVESAFGRVYSETIRIPADAVPDERDAISAAMPACEADVSIPDEPWARSAVSSSDFGEVAAPASDSPRTTRLRAWHVGLAVMALLLLLLMSWMLLPLPDRRVHRVAAAVGEHFPRAREDAVPMRWVEVDHEHEHPPRDESAMPSTSLLVTDDGDSLTFIQRDNRVYLVVDGGEDPMYVGPAEGFFPPRTVPQDGVLAMHEVPRKVAQSSNDAAGVDVAGWQEGATARASNGRSSEAFDAATGWDAGTEGESMDVGPEVLGDVDAAPDGRGPATDASDGGSTATSSVPAIEDPQGVAEGETEFGIAAPHESILADSGGASVSADWESAEEDWSTGGGADPTRGGSDPSGGESAGGDVPPVGVESDDADPRESGPPIERFARGVCWISAVIDETTINTGSGFLVSPRGEVVTSSHVVSGARSVTLRFPGGDRALNASVVANDIRNDVALLRVRDASKPDLASRWVFSPPESGPRIGEDVWAIGFPEFGLTVTRGVVSGVRRFSEFPKAYREGMRFSPESRWIQSDCAINEGNSGGPLVDRNGRLIGVVTWGATRVDAAGFALDARDAFGFLRLDGTEGGKRSDSGISR